MIDHSIRCSECTAYGGHHSVFCSQQTPEQIKDQLKQYYDAWLKLSREQHDNYAKRIREVVFWQGKFQMVKHENNQLRKKLYKAGLPKSKSA